MRKPPRFTVIVPTFNRLDQVQPSIESILAAASAHGSVEVIVVDNGSTDGTWQWLQEQGRSGLKSEQARGVTISALRNIGARHVKGEYISFIDSDCVVPADYFQRVDEVFSRVHADMVGSMYGLPADVHWIEETWMRLNCPVREGYATLLPGGSMVVRSSMFRRISGFNEALVTGEDAELCERVIAAGGTIYESHHVMLVHLRNMNSIRGFFQKQAWHALGMFGSTRGWKLDRVSQLMFAHLTFTVAAVLWVLFGVGPLAMRALVGLALLLFVPLFAVTYRIVVRGGDAVVLRGLVLYEVYFYARIWSLFRLAVGARLG